MKELRISRACRYGGSYDVVVCGGGPSGVCAAIAAARQGAKTLLLEKQGVLGGFWTSGLLTWVADIENKTGLVKELAEAMKDSAEGRYVDRYGNYLAADTERTKLLLERMCREAGVQVRLYTQVTDVWTEERQIKAVVTESKSGPEYFEGQLVIDATGDGDVGAYAGCRYEFGNGEGKTQPMSMIVHVAGVAYEDLERLYKDNPEKTYSACIVSELRRAGVEPSYIGPLFAPVSKEHNLFSLMVNHEYAVSGLDAWDLTRATMHAREEVFGYVRALQSLGGMWKDIYVVSSAPCIGVREGRRILGQYRVTRDQDLAEGRSHEDGVCRVTYGVDIHQYSAGSFHEDRAKKNAVKAYPYEIPLRALLAADVDNLLLAGRCISGDIYAHGNFRVGGNAARTGEAAGTAAGYSVRNNIPLREVCAVIKELLQ